MAKTSLGAQNRITSRCARVATGVAGNDLIRGGAVATLLLALALPAPAAAASGAASGIVAAPSRWWSEIDRLGELLAEEKWRRVARQAEDLRGKVARGSWREPDLARVFSELAFQLAVAHAELGDEERALWEWHSALAFERYGGAGGGPSGLMERDLSPYPRAGELLPAHPLRAAGEYPPGVPPVEVRPDRDLRPAAARAYVLDPLVNTQATREVVAPVHLEVFIDRTGRVSQPVVLTDWSNPVVVQWGLDALREGPRFEPARLDGKAVGWLAPVELSVAGQAPRRW